MSLYGVREQLGTGYASVPILGFGRGSSRVTMDDGFVYTALQRREKTEEAFCMRVCVLGSKGSCAGPEGDDNESAGPQRPQPSWIYIALSRADQPSNSYNPVEINRPRKNATHHSLPHNRPTGKKHKRKKNTRPDQFIQPSRAKWSRRARRRASGRPCASVSGPTRPGRTRACRAPRRRAARASCAWSRGSAAR